MLVSTDTLLSVSGHFLRTLCYEYPGTAEVKSLNQVKLVTFVDFMTFSTLALTRTSLMGSECISTFLGHYKASIESKWCSDSSVGHVVQMNIRLKKGISYV